MRKHMLSRYLDRFPDFWVNEDLSILLETDISIVQSINALRVMYLPVHKIAEIHQIADSADNFYWDITFKHC
jgi:hypothetical protein